MIHKRQMAVIVFLFVLVMASMACGTGSQPEGEVSRFMTTAPTEVPTEPPVRRLIILESHEGSIEIETTTTQSEADAAGVEIILTEGDSINVGDGGTAVLRSDDGTVLVLGPNSEMGVNTLSGTRENPNTKIDLNSGSIHSMRNEPLSEGSSFEVKTPSGIADSLGLAMSVSFNPETDMTVTTCLGGVCSLSDINGSTIIEISYGQASEINAIGDTPSEPRVMTVDESESWVDTIQKANEAGTDVDIQEEDVPEGEGYSP